MTAAATILLQFFPEITDQAADVVAAAGDQHGRTTAADADVEPRGLPTDAGTDAEIVTVTAITAGR